MQNSLFEHKCVSAVCVHNHNGKKPNG